MAYLHTKLRERAKLSIKMVNGESLEFDLKLTTTVGDLKLMISGARGTAVLQHSIFAAGGEEELKDSMQIGDAVVSAAAPVLFLLESKLVPKWLASLSENSLVWSDENRVVTRSGSMGCYPAAISDLRFDPRQQGSHHFSIKVEKFDATYNMLSFGLTDRQHFNQSGGNGIGGDSRSVGYQAEASSSNTTAILKSDRNQVGGDVPKVRAGCVMRLEVSFKNFPAHALQPTGEISFFIDDAKVRCLHSSHLAHDCRPGGVMQVVVSWLAVGCR
jgi:hypothetical protein